MRLSNIYIKNSFWFFLELILIFFLIEGISYAFGYYGEVTIAVSLLIVTALVFIIALIAAKTKDKNRKTFS